MIQLTDEFRKKVVAELLRQRANYDGHDVTFARQYGLSTTDFSRIKNGDIDKRIKDAKWLAIGRELGVMLNERKWKTARTTVFNMIEEDVTFCQQYSKARLCVDDCGIGKTHTAKYLSRTLKNCFYIDASQAKTKQQFVRLLAKTIGVDHNGKYADIKGNIKYYLGLLPQPVVIIDEAGDLDYKAFLELKEFWNATENVCGWYMMGADGLREMISRGIRSKKVGFREIFSRFSERYTTPVPTEREEKQVFYRQLISDVLAANMQDTAKINDIVRKCLTSGEDGQIGGLRRAEALLLLHQ